MLQVTVQVRKRWPEGSGQPYARVRISVVSGKRQASYWANNGDELNATIIQDPSTGVRYRVSGTDVEDFMAHYKRGDESEFTHNLTTVA